MKRAFIIAGIGAAAGYLFGNQAARAKLGQLTRKARDVAADPEVQRKVADVAGQVKEQAGHLPDPVAGAVRTAASQVQTKLSHDTDASPL
jgi:uncharacterized protein YjbJ (UPF0337 family)